MKQIYNSFLLLSRIIILTLIIINYNNVNNIVVLVSGFIITFYDKILINKLNINTAYIFKILMLLLIFGAQVFGTIFDFYEKYFWWDTMLHTLSGFIFFYAGIEIWEYINKQNYKNKILKIIFAFLFSIFCAVIWEFFEFGMDYFVGTNMQITQGFYGQNAIKDTMIDMLVATFGAIIGIIIYVRKGK